MHCPSCGKQNRDDTATCAFCGAPLHAPEHIPLSPRTSGMAIASLILGIFGITCIFPAPIAGLVLGILALGAIGRSRGRLAGRGLAIAGIVTSSVFSAVQLLILPALLLPALARAREQARQASCRSNLKQIGLAVHAYASDHGGQFPAGETAVDVFSHLLEKGYLSDPELFICPSASADIKAWKRVRKFTEETCSYDWVSGLNAESPPDFILAFDKTSDHHRTGGTPPGRNALFVDGHIEWMSESEFQQRIENQRLEMGYSSVVLTPRILVASIR